MCNVNIKQNHKIHVKYIFFRSCFIFGFEIIDVKSEATGKRSSSIILSARKNVTRKLTSRVLLLLVEHRPQTTRLHPARFALSLKTQLDGAEWFVALSCLIYIPSAVTEVCCTQFFFQMTFTTVPSLVVLFFCVLVVSTVHHCLRGALGNVNIADINNFSIITILYRRLRYRFFRYIDIVSLTAEISVISQYFIILYQTV